MDPRETLAHYLHIYREQKGLTLDELAKRTGVNKGQLYAAEHPDKPKYADRRAFVCNKLDDVLEELGLTFAPVDHTIPTVAHCCMMIGRLPIHPVAKSMAVDAVLRAGMTTPTPASLTKAEAEAIAMRICAEVVRDCGVNVMEHEKDAWVEKISAALLQQQPEPTT